MATSGTTEKRAVVRGLGEIALRVNNLDAMQQFYEKVIGLPLMTRVPNCAFFKIVDGYGGHNQVLALFDRSNSPGYRGPDAATSTIDHIAFEIPLADFAVERKRLETLVAQREQYEQALKSSLQLVRTTEELLRSGTTKLDVRLGEQEYSLGQMERGLAEANASLPAIGQSAGVVLVTHA